MGQYDRQIASAKRLIEKFGESSFWMQPGEGVVADATKPWLKTNGTDTPNAVPIVYLPRNRVNTAFMQALGKSEIRVGRVYGLMGAVSFVPTLADYVMRADGSMYKILSIDALNPNGQNILYTIDFDT